LVLNIQNNDSEQPTNYHNKSKFDCVLCYMSKRLQKVGSRKCPLRYQITSSTIKMILFNQKYHYMSLALFKLVLLSNGNYLMLLAS